LKLSCDEALEFVQLKIAAQSWSLNGRIERFNNKPASVNPPLTDVIPWWDVSCDKNWTDDSNIWLEKSLFDPDEIISQLLRIYSLLSHWLEELLLHFLFKTLNKLLEEINGVASNFWRTIKTVLSNWSQ
jgi:hypothetical protein